jgi:hypothetical protein
MGIDPINNITIIIRILFAFTLFQHSPLTRRVLFNSIRRERSASLVASGGQYHQYHLETLAGISASHRKFSSSATLSFSKEWHHHLHQYVLVKIYLITALGWHITVLHWLNVTADKLVALVSVTSFFTSNN